MRNAFLFLLLTVVAILGQTNQTTGQRSGSTNNTAELVFRDRVEPHWFADNNKFWYRVELPEKQSEFILVDAQGGIRTPAFDHERLAKALSEQTGKSVQGTQLPFSSIRLTKDLKTLRFTLDEIKWECELDSYRLSKIEKETGDEPEKESDEPARSERRRRNNRGAESKSPDGKWEIIVRGDNLFLLEIKTQEAQRFTHDGNPGHTYARDSHSDRAIGMQFDLKDSESPKPEIYWSPDSKRLVAMRTRAGAQRTVYLIESSPKDQLQPKLQSYPYLKPGDEIPIRKPYLFDVAAKKEIPISDQLFSNPWSINDLRWKADSSQFTFVFNQRGHQVLRIIAINAENGRAQSIIDEQSATFVHYSGKYFADYLEETDEIVWMSERDGWNHLYLYDAKTGQVKNQITKGDWLVRSVERVDKEKRTVWFRASGIRPNQDPYYIHFCRVNFDGTGLTILTEGDGTHSVNYSPDRRFLIDTYSRVDLPPVNELRRSEDGQLICKLESADISKLLATGWQPPQRFVAKGRDGTTDIYGIIHLPKNLNPSIKYPIIESIYAGPHDSFVPKPFRASYTQEKLTEKGFAVVQIDGMGTSNRSKKFHDVCYKNVGDAGFPDRILWIKAAAAQFPYLDLERVGIYGTSAGGQSALGGLLAHSDFYKAGVSDCGCHDNRMDKIWWNEQWMGWPVGPHYDEQSNVTQAHKLQGKLLLMVGELDKNVDPASTMQVVDALVKADKQFELLVMPGTGHGVARTPYGWRRIEEFFTRHLLQPEPGQETRSVATHPASDSTPESR